MFKRMDVVGFALPGCVTGTGGGTIRDVLMGNQPVFWVEKPGCLLACVAVCCATFFFVVFSGSRRPAARSSW